MTKSNKLFISLIDKQIEYLQTARNALIGANGVADELISALIKVRAEDPRKSAWKKRKKDGVV
jgi:hypothetical protein